MKAVPNGENRAYSMASAAGMAINMTIPVTKGAY